MSVSIVSSALDQHSTAGSKRAKSREGTKNLDPFELKALDKHFLTKIVQSECKTEADKIFTGTMFVIFHDSRTKLRKVQSFQPKNKDLLSIYKHL